MDIRVKSSREKLGTVDRRCLIEHVSWGDYHHRRRARGTYLGDTV